MSCGVSNPVDTSVHLSSNKSGKQFSAIKSKGAKPMKKRIMRATITCLLITLTLSSTVFAGVLDKINGFYLSGTTLKMKSGMQKSVIIKENVLEFKKIGDVIYFADKTTLTENVNAKQQVTLFSMDVKGKNIKKICIVDAYSFTIKGDYLYFTRRGILYRANTDGSSEKKMFKCDNIIAITSENILYEVNKQIFKSNLEGKDITKIDKSYLKKLLLKFSF